MTEGFSSYSAGKTWKPPTGQWARWWVGVSSVTAQAKGGQDRAQHGQCPPSGYSTGQESLGALPFPWQLLAPGFPPWPGPHHFLFLQPHAVRVRLPHTECGNSEKEKQSPHRCQSTAVGPEQGSHRDIGAVSGLRAPWPPPGPTWRWPDLYLPGKRQRWPEAPGCSGSHPWARAPGVRAGSGGNPEGSAEETGGEGDTGAFQRSGRRTHCTPACPVRSCLPGEKTLVIQS